MRAYELMKETLLRRSYIIVVHIVFFSIYAIMFSMGHQRTLQWGSLVFVLSGSALPFLLSAGIFGNDIATGRISVLITKPMRISELYIWRVTGLSLQCALHLVVSGWIIFILHSATDRGNMNNFGLWLFASWLLFNTWTTLLASLSVVVKRTNNSVILGCAIILVLGLIKFLDPEDLLTIAIRAIIKYGFPPMELMVVFAKGGYGLIQGSGYVVHALGLTVLYSIAGTIMLSKREFRSESD